MKNIFIVPLAAMALLLPAGCDKQPADVPVTGFPADGVVRVSAGGSVTRADGTSASGQSQYLGSDLGLFIDYGSGEGQTKPNVRWIREGSEWTADEQMLWKDATTLAALYAYAPYVAGQTSPSIAFTVSSDQTGGITGADFVFWKNESFVPNDANSEFVDGKVQISFTHALTRLTLNFRKAGQFASDVTVERATLRNASPEVTLDIAKGTVTPSSGASSDIAMHRVENVDALQYEAVFCPGKGQEANATMLEVTMSDGTVLVYNVPAGGLVSGGLQLGSAYSMNMTLGKDKIEIDGTVTVNDWSAVPEGDDFGASEAGVVGNPWDGTVASKFESGRGTEADPWIIANASQLAYLAQQVNEGNSYAGEYLKIDDKIDIINLANKRWTPIGNTNARFSGHFDGNGKRIYGLNVSPGGEAGLFGRVAKDRFASEGGSISNVRIESARIASTSNYAAVLCGYAKDMTIADCSVRGTVENSLGNVGGLVGYCDYTTMTNCTAEVSVKGTANVGGLCGYMESGSISDCSVVNSRVEGTRNDFSCAGGLVGRIQLLFQNATVAVCSVTGCVIKGVNYVGGLLGFTYNTQSSEASISISGCTASADLTVTGGGCGGIVGHTYGQYAVAFSDCGFDGTITKDGTNIRFVGAAVGTDESSASSFTDCWYNADKTDGLPKVGSPFADKDYSGIKAKTLGK